MPFTTQYFTGAGWADVNPQTPALIPYAVMSAHGLRLRSVQTPGGCISPEYQFPFPVIIHDDRADADMSDAQVTAALAGDGLALAGGSVRYQSEASFLAAVEALTTGDFIMGGGKLSFVKGLDIPTPSIDVISALRLDVHDGTAVLSHSEILAALAADGLEYASTVYADITEFTNDVIGDLGLKAVYDSAGGKFVAWSGTEPAQIDVTYPAVAKSALLLVGNSASFTAEDTQIAGYLTDLGYTYTAITSSSAVLADASAHDLVIISYSASGASGNTFEDVAKPVISFLVSASNNLEISDAGTTGFTASAIEILTASHPITSPYATGSLTIMTSSNTMAYAVQTTGIGSGATLLGARVGATTNVHLFAHETGTIQSDGSTAPARRVFTPVTAGVMAKLNAAGNDLMKRAIQWLVGDI